MGQFVPDSKTLLTSDNLYVLAIFFQAQLACALLKAGVVIILG